MARWPAAGRCKRRLAAGLGDVAAAAVQRRLQQHTLAVLDQLPASLATDGWLALGGAGRRAARRMGWSGTVVLQGGGALGLRLVRLLRQAARAGYQHVVVVGSDLPELASCDLLQAFAALQRAPVVLGPAADGGYWLVGLTQPLPRLFCGMTWGSDQVLAQTLAAARQLNVAVELLGLRHDLDRPTDLGRWR